MQRNCIFPGRYAPLTSSKSVVMSSWRVTPGKYAISLHTCISITDQVNINEQNKSIAVGLFYIGTYFEPIWTILPEDVAVLNPMGYQTLKRRYPACVRHINGFSHIVMVWVCCVTNRNCHAVNGPGYNRSDRTVHGAADGPPGPSMVTTHGLPLLHMVPIL